MYHTHTINSHTHKGGLLYITHTLQSIVNLFFIFSSYGIKEPLFNKVLEEMIQLTMRTIEIERER